MYNILIADDEKDIVNSIADDIAWDELDITKIFVADNGKTAMEIVENNRIDIILSDIMMPELDGIELARQVHLRFRHTKIIFMTGYDRFEFAQQALNQGVYSFLLKPISNEEFFATVQAALRKLRDEIELENAYQSIEQQLEEALPILQNRFLFDWIVGGKYRDKNNILEKINRYHIKLPADELFAPMVIRIDEFISTTIHPDRQFIAIRNLLASLLILKRDFLYFESVTNNYVILVPMKSREDLLENITYIKNMWDIFANSVLHSVHCILSMYIYKEAVNLDQISEYYNMLWSKILRHTPARNGMLNILSPSDIIQNYDVVNDLETYPSYSDLVSSLDVASIEKLENVFQQLTNTNYMTHHLLEIYFLLSHTLMIQSKYRGYMVNEWAGSDEVYIYSFERFCNAEEFMQWAIRITNKFILFAQQNEVNITCALVENVKNRVRKDVMETISISDMAEEMFVSTSHLSRVFKREMGMSIMDYIVNEKLKIAKRMLKEPGAKVYNVANALGYSSIPYFTRLFKREVGITPKEYQTRV